MVNEVYRLMMRAFIRVTLLMLLATVCVACYFAMTLFVEQIRR
jgi:hypothetical protein